MVQRAIQGRVVLYHSRSAAGRAEAFVFDFFATMESKPGSALIMIPRVLTYAWDRMASIVQNADRRAFMYLMSSYFQ